MKQLLKVEIPDYPTRIMLNRSRPAVYYTRKTKIPARYRTANYDFNAYGILIDVKSNTPIVANPLTANMPKFKKINGRDLLLGKISSSIRSLMLNELKRFFLPFFEDRRMIKEPCHIKIEICNVLGDGNQDLDNMSWILVKVIQEVLVESKVIQQNNLRFVQGFEVSFKPVNSSNERKLTVSIYATETTAVSALSY